MPNASSITLAIGAKQFVVHDAFEMILWFSLSSASSFTPSTIETSGSPMGALTTTYFAPASRCFDACSCVRTHRLIRSLHRRRVRPMELGWVALSEHLERVAIDDHVAIDDLNRSGIPSMHRVVAQEVRVGSAHPRDH